MSEHTHSLAEEFPEHKETIHKLKMENSHFKKLFDSYHEVDRSIGRSEQRIDVLSELQEEELRKERLRLKDEIYRILSETQK